MSTPHKHAECIKAWADGKVVEVLNNRYGRWTTVRGHPIWNKQLQYRIKPEPVEDVVHDFGVRLDGNSGCLDWGADKSLRLTFDGDTKELKKAEVL